MAAKKKIQVILERSRIGCARRRRELSTLPQRLRPFLESDTYGGSHLCAPRFHCAVDSITSAMRTVLHHFLS
ncbi:hypothetical protein [uncultured Nostoc sp.]|uniref:hypothetical protein n=1 Tax=uncultured Nostoc sp. TaxID=340711 RepID=UPI002608A573|nr:hypothetical protein [uncultured Nostoc sp.]